MKKHFALVHGAWHGGWCWDGVIEGSHEALFTNPAVAAAGILEATR